MFHTAYTSKITLKSEFLKVSYDFSTSKRTLTTTTSTAADLYSGDAQEAAMAMKTVESKSRGG